MQTISRFTISILCCFTSLSIAQTPEKDDCSSKFSDYMYFYERVEGGNNSYTKYMGCSRGSREECAKQYLITGAVETFNIVQEYNNNHENSTYSIANTPVCQKYFNIPKPLRAIKAI